MCATLVAFTNTKFILLPRLNCLFSFYSSLRLPHVVRSIAILILNDIVGFIVASKSEI